MASLKNAFKAAQRIHKERSQPEHRQHLGALEKKKDYKLRAKDYQEKRDALKVLRNKAADRNPDEFYFHMINSQCKRYNTQEADNNQLSALDGVHFEKDKEDTNSKEQEALMNCQNLNYINYKLNVERKKIEKIRADLQLLHKDSFAKNTHTIFVDSKAEAKSFDAAKHLNTHPALLARTYNRPRLDQLRKTKLAGIDSKETVAACKRSNNQQYLELLKRLQREKELKIVAAKLQTRKHLSDKHGGEKPVRVRQGTEKRAPVYRWKFIRKR